MNSWITPYMKKYRWRVLLSAFYALLGAASGALLLFVSGYLISKSSLQPINIMVVYIPIVSVRAFSIGQALFPYLEKLVSHDIVLRILSNYRERLYKILEPQAMFLQSRFQMGDLLTLLADDIERLQDLFIKTILPSVAGVVVYGVFAIVIGFFNIPFMLLILTVLGIIVFLIPILSYVLMVGHHVKVKEVRGKLYNKSTDALFGQFDWLVSGRVDEVLADIAKENRIVMNRISKINRWHRIRDFLLQFIAGVAVISIMIWSNWETKAEVFSPTIIAAFTLMMFSITETFFPISNAIEEIPTYDESLQRMEKLSKTPPEEKEPSPWNVAGDSTMVLKNVHYRYPGSEEEVISDLSFTIKPGEKVAVLGRSGAGKSTLLKLMAGIIKPKDGSIFIGEKRVHRDALAKSISVLNQKPHLFHTTVANNVRIGNANATDEQIIKALKRAEIWEFIKSLPEGIHTQMDEMGKRFSGGERQRIAFARALIQHTPIVLLDEPTTGLDPITEVNLIETFLSAAPEKTIVFVTHHLIGAEEMDRIIFIDEGRIKRSGSHQKLMNSSSYYRTLYEMDQGIITT